MQMEMAFQTYGEIGRIIDKLNFKLLVNEKVFRIDFS